MKNLSEQDNKQLTQMIQSCVHCGFCNATCPSYQVLGNELDGPRGRIYQIADLVSGESNDPIILQHLDTCLTCRNCEITCPSGVQYSKIFSLGKKLALARFGRSFGAVLKRKILVFMLVVPNRSKRIFAMASYIRQLLPLHMRKSIPKRERELPYIQQQKYTQLGGASNKVDLDNSNRLLLLEGCVQTGLRPNTNRALHNVLARLGCSVESMPIQLCCGALPNHNDHDQLAKKLACRIIEATEEIYAKADKENRPFRGLVMTSSACVLELKEFPWLLRHMPSWKARAEAFVAKVFDVSELLTPDQVACLHIGASGTVVFHPPCTLQHGQGNQRAIAIEDMLQATGLTVMPVTNKHLCCGSAGTYSIMQPHVAKKLREEKIASLCTHTPDYIATANIGCQAYIQEGLGENIYMWHWIELIENLANIANPLYK